MLHGYWGWQWNSYRASNVPNHPATKAFSTYICHKLHKDVYEKKTGMITNNAMVCVQDVKVKMVLWPGCEGRAEISLHTKNVRSVRFVVKRRGCCCNPSGGVALIVWFTTNGMCVKNNTIMYVERTSNNRVISLGDLYCCLLPRCEALRTCRSGFLIATVKYNIFWIVATLLNCSKQ